MSKPVSHYGKWRIRWTDENGGRHSLVFDSHRDAAYELQKKQAEVEEIRRGLRSPVIPDKRFDDLCEYWVKHRCPQKRSGKSDRSIIERHLRPAFGKALIRAVGVEAVDQYKATKAGIDQKTLSNHLTLLISMLHVAVDLGWLHKVPRIRKPKIPLFSKDFQFLRNKEELARFLEAVEEEGPMVYALYATAAYSGMREGEIAGLRWSDIDLNRRLICVQRSFDGPTKAGDVRYVPVLDALLPVIRDWRLKCQGSIVFPNEAGNMHQKSARVFQETLHRILDRCKFPTIERTGKQKRYIVFHSLRHTFASHWVMNGGDLFRLQKVLGHKSVQMTQRYAHLMPDAFVSDYSRLGGGIQDTARVLPLISAHKVEQC